MSFPTSPINGQETTINGITYIFSSSNNAWTRKPRQLFTAGVNAPANPAAGDQWYDTSDDILYQYLNDGTNSYWVDIRSGIFGGNAATLGETLIQGNLIPVANVVYSLGNTTNRFKDLFLSGSTIDLGGATIKTDATSGAIALIPQPTVANPNPTGIVVSPSGTVSTVSTTGGTLATNAISNSSNTATTTNTTTFGNIVADGNVTANRVTTATGLFWSNGTAFSSGSSFGNTEVAGYFTSNTSGIATRTDAINVPVGTTAERPATTSNGAIRYNNTLGSVEVYLPSGGWTTIIADRYTIEYLVVAGGGGGGRGRGGGGGGGGYRSSISGESSGGGSSAEQAVTVTPGNTYTVVVGGGGLGGQSSDTKGSNGVDSSLSGSGISTITSIGGGAGGGAYQTLTSNTGGSGGGGAGQVSGGYSNSGGAGTANQGYAGGNTPNYNDSNGAGGGGAGAVGTYQTGGVGVVSSVTGSAVYRAGGGGGGGDNSSGPGGNGGGGAGSTGAATNGTTNTGGGGGGSIYNNTAGTGGSGIVIIRYQGAQRGTGGNVSTVGSYTVHTFTGSGSFLA
jgi:hypothetical protein